MLSVVVIFVSHDDKARMRVFKNKAFARFARKNEVTDADLCSTIQDANRGFIDADLGGGVIKQRIARRGAGKSGGFRAMIVFRLRALAIFIHGFAKSELGNISPDELFALKKTGFRNAGLRRNWDRQGHCFGNAHGGAVRWETRSSIVAV